MAGSRWWDRVVPLRHDKASVGTSTSPLYADPPAEAGQHNGHHPAETIALADDQGDGKTPRGKAVPGWGDGVLDKICGAYKLGTPSDWSVFAGAPREKRLLLTADGRKFVVRAVNGGSRGILALEAELDLVEFLRSQHYPVAELVRTGAGSRYLSIRGYHYLMTVLEQAGPYDTSNRTHCVEAATGLAQFHEVTRDFAGTSPLGSAPYLMDVVEQRADWIEATVRRYSAGDPAWGRTNHLLHALLGANDELRALLPGIAAAYEGEPRTLIHGSYDRLALSFDGLGLAEVGNLDQVGLDVRLADLSRSMLAFCTVEEGDEVSCIDMDPAIVSPFLASYEHVSPLSPLEVETLPLFLRAIHLAKVVDDARRLLKIPASDIAAENHDRDARALCLALQLGYSPRQPRPEDSS